MVCVSAPPYPNMRTEAESAEYSIYISIYLPLCVQVDSRSSLLQAALVCLSS